MAVDPKTPTERQVKAQIAPFRQEAANYPNPTLVACTWCVGTGLTIDMNASLLPARINKMFAGGSSCH
ncbi:hypothetical protein BaRGS_00000273 [Batillaria attramentaria]|uniref:Uncharacterized protein n=1 Tax=Batillaria attramentaria TaxID=370345 RepID=A0ABD0MC75_9CAEN